MDLNKNARGNCIHHKPLQIIKKPTLTSICIEFPKSLYTVAIKGWEQGFTQTCQWAMAPLLAMVHPMVLKSQNHNITVLHNQKWTSHIAE